MRPVDLSLQCRGNHDRVAEELEQASTGAWLPSSRRQSAKWPSRRATPSPCEQVGRCGQRRSVSRRQGRNETLVAFFTSGKRASTTVRRARREKSKWRVQQIRKIDGSSSVPLRQRLAMIVRAVVAKANRYGISVTGLNETQMRLHERNFTITAPGSDVDPVYDAFVPVVALTHTSWERWMPPARSPSAEWSLSNRTAGQTRSPSRCRSVATLNRMQWTIIENDPFVCCMHDGSVVEHNARTACTHSSSNQRKLGSGGAPRHTKAMDAYLRRCFRATATRACQCAWDSPEKRFLASGRCRWTVAAVVEAPSSKDAHAPVCALCGNEDGSSFRGTFSARNPLVQPRRTCQALSARRPNEARYGNMSRSQRGRCSVRSTTAQWSSRYSAGKAIETCSLESCTAMARRRKGRTQNCAGTGEPAPVSGSMALFMFLRIARAARCQPPWRSHRRWWSVGATTGVRLMPAEFHGTPLSAQSQGANHCGGCALWYQH